MDENAFDPAKHPRSENGQFSSSQSASAPSSPSKQKAKGHVFSFKVGGVNSYPEDVFVTASTFRKAAYEACLRAANGKKKYFHRTWVKPLSVNGHDISRYDTIEGDRFTSDQNIDRTENAVRQLLSSQPNQSGGNVRGSHPQKPVQTQTGGASPHGAGCQSGLVLRTGDGQGNVGYRDGQLHRQIPSESSSIRTGRYVDVRPDGSIRASSPLANYGAATITEKGNASPASPASPSPATPSQMMFSFDHACAMDAYPRKKLFFRQLIRTLSAIAEQNTVENKGGKKEEKGNASNAKLPRQGGHAHGRTCERVSVVERTPLDVTQATFRPTPAQVRSLIKGNCDLIKTVPHGKKLNGIENRIKRLFENTNTTKGTLQRYLEKGCGLLPYQAKRIIDDQIIKYNARMQLEDFRSKGVKMVRWCPGECEHHRPSHIAKWPTGLAGCVFPIDDPPADPATGLKQYPGEAINCHCYLEAVE